MSTTMKVEIINPFVASTINVLKTMCSLDVKRGQIYLQRADATHSGLSGVIGLTGKAKGAASLNIGDQTAIRITERFLGTEIDAVNADVVDCVGELVNMVAGSAKVQLQEYQLSISLPSIIRGNDHIIQFPSQVSPVAIPFTSEVGDLLIQVGFVFSG